MEGMLDENPFGRWLRRRRRQMDLTQQQLADRAACSLISIRKFEAGERRPSRELALLLATCLEIPASEQESFVALARGLPTELDAAASAPTLTSSPTPIPLPTPATPFVDRSTELTQIATLLADPACRLLTLVGFGGMGKTRLALAAATAQKDNFRDGVVFVSLATATEPSHLAPAIAQSLGLTLTGTADPAIQITRYLHNKQMLLLLDNFEPVSHGAERLSHWLHQVPHSKWLVTTRERLQLVEEWLLPVQGFAELASGVTLFVQSARRVQPHFSLTGQETTVAHICQALGGMPLAIELAASWVAILTCEQILLQLEQPLDFLESYWRNTPERQRSLRHILNQTWHLLSAPEQNILQKLSVFQGGFAWTEAAVVAQANLPLLSALINKSLVTTDGRGRYNFHPLIRLYAGEYLAASGPETTIRRLHLETFTHLAETAEPHLYGPDAIVWFKRLAGEQGNFQAALTYAIEQADGASALRLSNALWWFWFRRGQWREAEQWLTTTLELVESGDNPARGRALLYLSTCIALGGRYDAAAPLLIEALTLARRLEEGELLASALMVLGQALPDGAQALATFAEAQAVWEQVKEKDEKPWVLAHLHYLVGDRLRENGRYTEAEGPYRQSLALYRQMGNVDSITYPLGNLGRLALQQERLDEAAALLGESLTLARISGNRQGIADWLVPFGLVTLSLGDTASALSYLQEALVLHDEMENQRGRAETLIYLALAELVQGNHGRARQSIRDSLAFYRAGWQRSPAIPLAPSHPHIVPDLVDALFVAALVEVAHGVFKQAITLLVIANRLQQQIGHQSVSFLQHRIEEAFAAAQQHLASSEYEAARHTGDGESLHELLSTLLM